MAPSRDSGDVCQDLGLPPIDELRVPDLPALRL
jgi:hypothetical protein